VWVHGPGAEPWEVYAVKADAETLTKQADSVCCATGQAREVPAGERDLVGPAEGIGQTRTPACC
jgi:hypothetical protein